MIDQYGRNIDYMRVSITDRCNLRCKYCMPNGIQLVSHSDILSYEELLRLCRVAVGLGIVKFKITGGEPLVRKGCVDFIQSLKTMPGVEQVTITTNGLLLPEYLDPLCAAGIDGVNVSLDTLDADRYDAMTGSRGQSVEAIRSTLAQCVARGLRVKVNTVLLEETLDGILQVAALAGNMPLDVRFIELMPIGEGSSMTGVSMERALAVLRERWPDLRPTGERRGNGPARYYASDGLQGRIGFISAVSHEFCGGCNRVRLTATGAMKPCLCYEEGVELGPMLQEEWDDQAIGRAMWDCIAGKPASHCFSLRQQITERKTMNRIGG